MMHRIEITLAGEAPDDELQRYQLLGNAGVVAAIERSERGIARRRAAERGPGEDDAARHAAAGQGRIGDVSAG